MPYWLNLSDAQRERHHAKFRSILKGMAKMSDAKLRASLKWISASYPPANSKQWYELIGDGAVLNRVKSLGVEVRREIALDARRQVAKRFFNETLQPLCDGGERLNLSTIDECIARSGDDAAIAAEAGFDLCMHLIWRCGGMPNDAYYTFVNLISSTRCGQKVRGGGKKAFAIRYGTPENRQQENAELQQCLEKCLDDHPEWSVTGARIEVVRLLGRKYKITDYKTVERRTTNPRKAMQNN